MPELLAALDAFVLTSRMEANPVSILEAMASGKPVVAPRVGSISETVADGVTGFVTDPGSVDQVVARVAELLSDRALAERMGQGGRAAVAARGSLEAMVGGYERLLSELYESKASPRGAAPHAAPDVSPRPGSRLPA